jgi:hypothetical protein
MGLVSSIRIATILPEPLIVQDFDLQQKINDLIEAFNSVRINWNGSSVRRVTDRSIVKCLKGIPKKRVA